MIFNRLVCELFTPLQALKDTQWMFVCDCLSNVVRKSLSDTHKQSEKGVLSLLFNRKETQDIVEQNEWFPV